MEQEREALSLFFFPPCPPSLPARSRVLLFASVSPVCRLEKSGCAGEEVGTAQPERRIPSVDPLA